MTRPILFIAAALMLIQYAWNRSFWLDEAWLALNVVEHTPAELLRPLDNHMVGPVGFLLVSKALVAVLGDHDYVLRLLPLGFALGALVAMDRLARRLHDEWLAAIMATLVFINPLTIYYSSEYKPYGVELFFTLLGMDLYARDGHDPNRLARSFSVLTLVAVWFTYAVYIFIGAVLAAAVLRRGARRRVSDWTWPLLAVLVAGAYAVFFVLGHAHGGFMRQYFLRLGHLYEPDTAFPTSLVRWLAAQPLALLSVFRGLQSVLVRTGLEAVTYVVLAGVVGYRFWRLGDHPWRALFDFAALLTAVHLVLAAAGRYPFDTRFLLYLLPLLGFQLAAVGSDLLARATLPARRVALAGLWFVSVPGFVARHPAAFPFEIDNVKATVAQLERYRPRRVIAVGLVRHTLRYYAPHLPVDTVSMHRALATLNRATIGDSTAIVFSRWGMPPGFDVALSQRLRDEKLPVRQTEYDNSVLLWIAE